MSDLLGLLLVFVAGACFGVLLTFVYVVIWNERMWTGGRR